jgi:hypothetical protein
MEAIPTTSPKKARRSTIELTNMYTVRPTRMPRWSEKPLRRLAPQAPGVRVSKAAARCPHQEAVAGCFPSRRCSHRRGAKRLPSADAKNATNPLSSPRPALHSSFVPHSSRERPGEVKKWQERQVRSRIWAWPHVVASDSRTLSRWRPGFESRWDYGMSPDGCGNR